MFERGNIFTGEKKKKSLKKNRSKLLCFFLFFCFWEVGWGCSTFIYGVLIELAIFHTLVEIWFLKFACHPTVVGVKPCNFSLMRGGVIVASSKF